MKASYWQILLHVVPSALLALVIGSLLVGVGIGACSFVAEAPSFQHIAVGWAFGAFLALFAVPLGFFSVLLFGAPAYALLVRLEIAGYWSAATVGALPGLLLFALQRHEFWGAFMLFGIPVALCTHYFAKRTIVFQAARR